jgi:hypothetical protein
MGLRGPTRTRTPRSRAVIGSTRPVRRSSSCGRSTDAPSFSRSFRRPSLDLRSPTECITGKLCHPAGFPAGQTTLPLVDSLCSTTQSQASGYVSRQRIPPPPRAACGVWIPPARPLPPALPTLSRRSVHELHPSRCSLRRNRHPSRGPCLPAVTGFFHSTPKSATCSHSRLQGLVPATNPCGHRNHEWFQPSIPSWGSTLQSLLPLDLALALIAAPPLAPLGSLTSKHAWASGYWGANGSADPSPDRHLSWASLPSDGHGAPYIAPRGGRIALPLAQSHRSGTDRSMPLSRDATTDPGPVARHRRHSACVW